MGAFPLKFLKDENRENSPLAYFPLNFGDFLEKMGVNNIPYPVKYLSKLLRFFEKRPNFQGS